MRQRVYAHRYIILSALLFAFAASAAMAETGQGAGRLEVRITNEGIVEHPTGQLGGGLYVVTIKNETCGHRGLVMKGIDRAVSPYIRFSKVLAPGHQQSFRWYFPNDRKVAIRDLLACKHEQRSCVVAGVGGMTTTLNFA
jgi:hypothetical protein